eukprot:COSAG04_NODE_91_length_26852_cov_8.609315_7_plen_171_part_00
MRRRRRSTSAAPPRPAHWRHSSSWGVSIRQLVANWVRMLGRSHRFDNRHQTFERRQTAQGKTDGSRFVLRKSRERKDRIDVRDSGQSRRANIRSQAGQSQHRGRTAVCGLGSGFRLVLTSRISRSSSLTADRAEAQQAGPVWLGWLTVCTRGARSAPAAASGRRQSPAAS